MEIISVPRRFYDQGEYESPVSNPLDPTWSRVKISLSRESWPVTFNLTFEAHYTTDGVNWRRIGAATAVGGDVLDDLGNIETHSWFNIPLPSDEVGITTRQLKAKAIVSERIRTAVTVEAF